MSLRRLHRHLGALLALAALAAFVSGAGLEAPSILPAAALLLLALVVDLPERWRVRAEVGWRVFATLLALRVAYHVAFVPADVVLPMVDLLLLLVLAEIYRAQDVGGEARLYALTFALLIASAAYRPGIVFGLAYVLFVTVLTLALIVAHLGRRAREQRTREPRLPPRFLRQSAGASAIVLLVSALVFLAFPRVSRGWGPRPEPPLRSVIGFSDRVSLLDHGGELHANPEVVLRVEFPTGPPPAGPLYFRGRSYDQFDGWSWARSPFLPTQWPELERWPQGRTEQLIYQRNLGDATVLFGLSPILRVESRSRIAPYRENNGDYNYRGSAEPVYHVTSARTQPHPDSLRVASGSAPRMLAAYRRLPPLSARMSALADSLVRGLPTDYDRAVAVRDWLRREFRYTVELPRTAQEAALEHFLFERRAGHCEYFSTAMVVLLRAAGVPARNVNGFLGGEWNEFGGYLTVTQNQAHSWAEVWFPGFGWVLFDPTPAGEVAGAAAVRPWWLPLRFLADGLEHRWGKWVLDFDLEDQARMARRAVGALEPRARRGGEAALPPTTLLLGALPIAVVVALWRARRANSARPGTARGATRAWLRLRRVYDRHGWDEPHLPALRFAARLEQHGAPGAAEVAAAARLYSHARFGPAGSGEADPREITRLARVARSALRRARHSRLQPGPLTAVRARRA